MIDGSTYGFVFELNGEGLQKDENTRQLIVPRMKKLPSKVNKLDTETGIFAAYVIDSNEFFTADVQICCSQQRF